SPARQPRRRRSISSAWTNLRRRVSARFADVTQKTSSLLWVYDSASKWRAAETSALSAACNSSGRSTVRSSASYSSPTVSGSPALTPPVCNPRQGPGPANLRNGGHDGENPKMDSVDVRQPGARESHGQGSQGQESGPQLGREGRLRGGRRGRRAWDAGALPRDRRPGI